MNFSQIFPILMMEKNVKNSIESITKQPAEYVGKCFNAFLNELNNGPGLVNKVAEQQTTYNNIFQAGISMGFTDYESVIAASGYAGYSPVDVVTFFRNNYGWENITVEEVEMIGKNIAPKFKKKLIQYGYLKEDEAPASSGIPKTKEMKNYGSEPPWRKQQSVHMSSGNPSHTTSGVSTE